MNSSPLSKRGIQKPAGALNSCFTVPETLHRCAPTGLDENRTRDFTVKIEVCNRCATSVWSQLEFLTLLITSNCPQLPCILYRLSEENLSSKFANSD